MIQPHHNTSPETETKHSHILVLGQSAREIASSLQHINKSSDVKASKTLADALAMIETQAFDHILIDNRDEGPMSLAIPILVETNKVENIVVLSGSQNFGALSAMPGLNSVIQSPFSPSDIIASLGMEIDAKVKKPNVEKSEPVGEEPSNEASVSSDAAANEPSAPAAELDAPAPVITDSRPPQTERPQRIKSLHNDANEQVSKPSALKHVLDAIGFTTTILPRLTPLFSMLYKNLALFILASLFLAFVGYGIMIAFFLVSEGWSSPIQLQRGHELVQKADRLHNEMLLKRNLVIKQLSEARHKASRGTTALERAAILSQITNNTIEQEITSRKAHLTTIDSEIQELGDVVKAFNTGSSRNKEKAQLISDYKKRIISRRIFQQSMLNLAQLDKNVLSLRESYSDKVREKEGLDQSIEFFGKLKQRLLTGDKNIVLTGGTSEYSNITLQVVEVERIEASGLSDLDEYEKTKDTFEHSINLLDKSLSDLQKTPMYRAIKEPVNALFIPYQNMEDYSQGEPLYACAIAIFWCNQVGTVGQPVAGEITTTHPFFGKPIRGQFVEANLSEKSAAKKEIIHVGRPPLFF